MSTLVTFEEVLAIHQATLQEHGGSAGIRDEGALDSAINQPRQSFDGVDLYRSSEEKTAALGFSLIQNGPL